MVLPKWVFAVGISLCLHAGVFFLWGMDTEQPAGFAGKGAVSVAILAPLGSNGLAGVREEESLAPPATRLTAGALPEPEETGREPERRERLQEAVKPRAQPPKPADVASLSGRPTQRGTGGRPSAHGGLAVVDKPDVLAMPLYHLIPKPPYPKRSRDLWEQGTVVIAILVGEDGRVAKADIATPSGYPRLDWSALSTVKEKWRFKPASHRGKPVASWVQVPIEFRISAQ